MKCAHIQTDTHKHKHTHTIKTAVTDVEQDEHTVTGKKRREKVTSFIHRLISYYNTHAHTQAGGDRLL